MPIYEANRAAFTPVTGPTPQNWTLWADASGDHALVKSVHWGEKPMPVSPSRTRWLRPSADGATPTTIAVAQNVDLNTVAAGCNFCTLAATMTLSATESLYLTSWNAFGGLGRYSMDDEEAWEILNGVALRTQIVCVNDVNTTATSMSCGLAWKRIRRCAISDFSVISLEANNGNTGTPKYSALGGADTEWRWSDSTAQSNVASAAWPAMTRPRRHRARAVCVCVYRRCRR